MKTNADGSVDVYVGPKAPAGLETNWISTMGKGPYLWLHLYWPILLKQAVLNRSGR
jgi:hypothetical protein